MLRTSQDQLFEIFSAVGLRRGDNVVVHSSLFALGLLEGGVAGFYQVLRRLLGEDSSIVVPTFTYSFRRNEVFDIRLSPGAKNIGVFSEFLRSQPNAVRSADPMFSMAAIGPRASELLVRTTPKSFGEGSVFARLFTENVKFLGVGITYSTGFTGFVHLECLARVPYRTEIELYGRCRDINGTEYGDVAVHYARNEADFAGGYANREQMGEILEASGASKAISYGGKKIICMSGKMWQETVLAALSRDPLLMLDRSKCSERSSSV